MTKKERIDPPTSHWVAALWQEQVFYSHTYVIFYMQFFLHVYKYDQNGRNKEMYLVIWWLRNSAGGEPGWRERAHRRQWDRWTSHLQPGDGGYYQSPVQIEKRFKGHILSFSEYLSFVFQVRSVKTTDSTDPKPEDLQPINTRTHHGFSAALLEGTWQEAEPPGGGAKFLQNQILITMYNFPLHEFLYVSNKLNQS